MLCGVNMNAMKREYAIKQLSREEKLKLIKDGNVN